RRHTRSKRDWSSDVCSSDLLLGFVYSNGSIYDRLDGNCLEWEIFEGDETPQVFSIRGMSTAAALGRFTDFDEFEKSIRDPDYARSEERRVGKECRAWWGV